MDEQKEAMKKFIAEKIAEETPLAEIQKALNQQFGTKLTFLEVRLLASELDSIDWSKKAEKAPAPQEENASEKAEAVTPEADATNGKTIIEMSKIERPGIMASGSVKFISGVSAEWMIDNTGRCGLDKVNGKPTEEDFMDFQKELQKLFS